jgi:tetratricopeptide (TPR) repeat protein
MNEGAAAEIRGDYARSAASYRDATALIHELAPGDPGRMHAWNFLATMYDALGHYTEAEGAYRRGLRAAEDLHMKASPTYALILGNLGTLYLEIGQMARSEKLLREALAISSAANPIDEVRVAAGQNCLAECLSFAGKYREADTLLTSALNVLPKYPKAWSENVAAMNNLGVVRLLQKRFTEAERLLRAALALMEQHLGPDHPMLIRTVNNLATVENRTGRREAAGESLRRAMSITEKSLGTEHPVYGALLANYATYLRQGGEKSRARALEAKSTQILQDAGRRNGIGAVVDVSALRGK